MRKTIEAGSLLVQIVFVLTLLSCSAKTGMPIRQPLHGTWINGNQAVGKEVMGSDGTWKLYNYVEDAAPIAAGTYKIYKQWTDASGNSWYQNNYAISFGPYKGLNDQSLERIDKEGKVWEFVLSIVGKFDPSQYPTAIDKTDPHYYVYYRSDKP